MSKRNIIVLNHKNCFSKHKQIINLFSEFKKRLSNLKAKKFLVAISGGPDSLALAAMCKAYEISSKKKFFYIHIDHGIRKESSRESKQVQKILKEQDITIKIVQNRKKIKNNIQKNARNIRYELLDNECKKRKIKYILTAHHKDDQVETFLIRLSRGSGVQGLSAMSIATPLNKRITILRPLLNVSKKDLVFTTKKIFGTYLTDPSNINKKFLRSNIRKLLPLLKKYGIDENQILKSISNLKSSSQTINLYLNDVLKKLVKKEKNKFKIKKKELFALNSELQFKVFSYLIKLSSKSYYPPRSKKIFTALNFLNNSKDVSYSLGGCQIVTEKNHVFIQKNK